MVSDDEDDARAQNRRVVKVYVESEKGTRPGMSGDFVKIPTKGSCGDREVAQVGADTTGEESDEGK